MYLFLFLTSLLNLTTATDTMASEPAMLYLSNDLGNHWEPFDCGLPSGTGIRDVIEQGDNHFLLTTENEVYVLPQGADSWQLRSAGLENVKSSTCLAAKGNLLVLGTYDNGVYISKDGGKNWRRPFFSITNTSVHHLLFHENVLLAGTDTGIWRSYDGGEIWAQDKTDKTIIYGLAVHQNQVYVARQNGMGVLNGKQINWADVTTEWAIGPLFSQGDYLYALPAKGNMIRSKDGVYWENQQFHIKCMNAQNLPEALWDGYKLDLPTKKDAPPAAIITTTSRGWFAGAGNGC